MLRIKQFKTIFLVYFFKLFSFLNKKKHWVIFERGTDARDNGYIFYKYIKDNYSEIKVYYIIDKNSVDYGKVEQDAIHFGSVKNYWAMATAQKKVSTHCGFGIPFVGNKVYNICKLDKKYFFLQHGVVKDNLIGLHKNNTNLELFICGAKPEYEYVLNNFGHSADVVKYTGLARYDNLHNFELKNQILVMPTWRSNIKNREELLHSAYYEKWQSFLCNKELLNKLNRTGIKLVFYVHYEMQKYIDCFKSVSDNIILARFEDYDVQTLLKESKVLITDYSSVYFDFAYMRKPVVYYHFDDNHYEKGYFDYKSMGFGDVCNNEKEVIDSLMLLFDNGFSMESKYHERAVNFFPLHDTNNCKRIFDCIMER